MSLLDNWKKIIPMHQESNNNQSMNALTALQQEFMKTVNNFNRMLQSSTHAESAFQDLKISPAIDVVEDHETYKVEMELPGVDENNIQITMNNRELNIKATKKISRKNSGKQYYSREIGYGFYERSIPLPANIDLEHPRASFRKGMLWVVFPKLHTPSKTSSRIVKVEKA